MKKFLVACAVLVLASYISGCDSGPPVVPAEGVVKLKGAPLATAIVNVHYADGNVATGVSDAQGKFSLTYMGKVGALPGSNLKVSVVKQTSEFAASTLPSTKGPPKSEAEEKAMMEAAIKTMKDSMDSHMKTKTAATPKNEIDAKYSKSDTSGLQVTIPEGGSKELVIDVP